jgi:DNA-binding transcriptional LysR family regulator
MLKDFSKLETFLTVIKEKSFSKASAKLGISQPAVTQQIKHIEDYLGSKIIERKKNGIKLTKEGDDFFKIASRLNKALLMAEKDVLKIINKEFTFKLGASFTIGHYIVPFYVENIKDQIKNEVFITIDKSSRMLNKLMDKDIDLALVESFDNTEGLILREWLDDELVIFSNQPIPKILKKEELFEFQWICRDEGSPTRKIISEAFEDLDVECSNFDVKGIVDNSTVAKETISHCQIRQNPTVSIISRKAIQKELENQTLFEARIRNYRLRRKLYIAYNKEKKNDAFLENVVNYLLKIRV